MRRAAVLPLLSLAFALAILLAPTSAAQPPSYTEAYQVRGAIGDIPSTAATEPSNAWNIEQRVLVQASNASQAVTVQVPWGASLVNASCSCGSEPTVNGQNVAFQVTGAGQQTITVLSTQASSRAFGFEVMRPGPGIASGTVVILYIPSGYEVEAPLEGTSPGLSTDGSARIVEYRGAEVPNPFWASLHVATTAGGDDGPASGDSGLNPWLMLALGALLGVILWAFLVSKGTVQAKGRKQVAATAAHVEAAANDPPAVLEGKKRALLAALKEIEVAKMNNEMPNEVYDAVKADLKRQAVTVMRALETSAAAGESKSA